jgi:hypothetical protein
LNDYKALTDSVGLVCSGDGKFCGEREPVFKDPNDQNIPMTAASFVEYDPVGFLIVDQVRIPATGH